MNTSRRAALQWLSSGTALWTWPALAKLAEEPVTGSHLTLLQTLRSLQLEPSWYTSANWANRSYDPWTDYISGEMSEAEFSRVCARITDYCLRDIWNLHKPVPDPVDWARTPPNWNGVHALVLRFFRSGKPVYLAKWTAVVDDYARWTEQQASAGRRPTSTLSPAPLLHAAFTWGSIFTACGIAAKALTHPESKRDPERSPYAPVEGIPTAEQAKRLPAEFLARIAAAFARGPAPDLAKAYVQARYVPNQRVFGMEAIALGIVVQPGNRDLLALRPALDVGVAEAAGRYMQIDGGQLEQSFNYARDVIDGLTRLKVLPLSPVPAWRPAAADAVAGWQRFSQAVALPGGGWLPQLGNAAAGRVAVGTELRFAATSMAFPYSGVYCQRSDWTPGAGYLFFFARRAARGHSMAGGNSVQVQAFGRPLLVAGGSADYRPVTDATRASAAYLNENSTWKTSTVLVDGLSQQNGSVEGLALNDKGKPDITRVPTAPIKARWLASEGLDYLEGHHTTGYQHRLDAAPGKVVEDVSHWRQVVFVRPLMLWLVVDVLQSSAQHRYTQIWKFAPPGEAGRDAGFQPDDVVTNGQDQSIRTRKAGNQDVNVGLYQFCPVPMSYRKHFASNGFGYFSRGPLSEAQPGVDVHAEWDGQGPQVCITAIVPQRGNDPVLKTAESRSVPGLAACDLITASGATVSAAASATPRPLSAGGSKAAKADLLVVAKIPGRAPLELVISAAASTCTDGAQKTAVEMPAGFRWTQAGADGLSPVYR